MMAKFLLRHLWWVAVILLLPRPSEVDCRNVTHEDIRDAMLSLVHMFRTSEDKLERHEYREKALGDQFKRMLIGLEKKHKALEPLKGIISRLDERLSNVETILLQRDEREKSTQKKTNEALESIQRSLATLTGGGAAASPGSGGSTDDKLEAIRVEVENVKSRLSKESLQAICLEASNGIPFSQHISNAEQLLSKYDLKLNEYAGNTSRPPPDYEPLHEIAVADEAWHSKMSEVMERQEGNIKQIQRLLSDAEGLWKDLPRKVDLQELANQTLTSVETVKDTIVQSTDVGVTKLTGKLRELSDRLVSTNQDIQNSLTQGNTMSERVYGEIVRSYETLRSEVQTLSKNEHVLIETADNVLATKKRIEYGVHQILLEVGELIKTQNSGLNRTINERFNSIEATIVEMETGALSNLSSKIETEMSQVWRQIGIMYQQLTASKISLDKLTEQTENYVNGSALTMENMKDKVSTITSRISEVDENLNYLLGRLSLVTQEFNQIKAGLGEVLDNIKTSFIAVKRQIKDNGPGPHAISSAESNS